MNNNAPTINGLDRGRPQPLPLSNDRISFREAFDALTAIYREFGLSEAASIQAAHADLKMRYSALALAA